MSSSSTPTRSASPARKLEQKIYYKHTGYAGGLKEVTAGKVLEGRFPERVLEKAVERMIPRGPLGRDQMRALHLYNGTEHPHGGQNPRNARRRVDEPQEQGGRIMADKKSLSDLGELTNPKPEAPAAPEAQPPKPRPRPPRPRLPPKPRAASTGRDGRRGRDEAVTDHGVSTQGPQIEAVLREQQLDKQGRAYATGRRKDAVARVWLKPGSGKIVINGREQEVYFARPTLRLIINQVFDVTDRKGQYDVDATVKGGGLSGQAGAVRHGISTALTRYEPALRTTVKREGFLTRDSARRRAQEVRPRQGPPQLPVLEALSRFQFALREGRLGYPGRPFFLSARFWTWASRGALSFDHERRRLCAWHPGTTRCSGSGFSIACGAGRVLEAFRRARVSARARR